MFRTALPAHLHGMRDASPELSPQEVVVADQSFELLRIFQRGTGTWMDVLDHSLSFQRQAIELAFSSSLLLHSICAVSAKHMSFVAETSIWEPVASSYYGEGLRLLIKDLNESNTSHDTLLAATILLSSYELLATAGPDHEKHLYGARTIIQTRGLRAKETSLQRASFWIYARQDVALALVNEGPTFMPSTNWNVMLPSDGAGEDTRGNKMLWLLARAIDLRFKPVSGTTPSERYQALMDISNEINRWWNDLAPTARGVTVGDNSGTELPKIWFCVPAAGKLPSSHTHYPQEVLTEMIPWF